MQVMPCTFSRGFPTANIQKKRMKIERGLFVQGFIIRNKKKN